jgi:hypothetical protein
VVKEGGVRNLLTGPSAYVLLTLRMKYTAYYLIVPITLVFLSAFHIHIQWVSIPLSILLCLGGVPFVYLIPAVPDKDRAEVSAGYTTLRQQHIELEQRDPYLGRVIRKPGEPYLERDQFKEIASHSALEWKQARATASR